MSGWKSISAVATTEERVSVIKTTSFERQEFNYVIDFLGPAIETSGPRT